MESIFGVAQELLFQYWTFLVASLLLGMIGSFSKKRIWTMERAKGGSPRWFWWWGRASLGFHAPIVGALLGMTLRLIYGTEAPSGPGINSAGDYMFYYLGAGITSSWVFAGSKHFAKSRGIDVDPVDMPGDSIIPMKLEVKERLAAEIMHGEEEKIPPADAS